MKVEEFKATESEMASNSFNWFLETLSCILHWAVDAELLKKEKLPKIRKVKTNNLRIEEDQYLDFARAKKVKEVANGIWKPMIEFDMKTGLRWSELSELRKSDINFKKRTLSITRAFSAGEVGPPKTDTSIRDIPLSKKTYQVFKETM